MATTRRVTSLGVNVETLPDKYRRLTAIGVQVETLPDKYRRLSAIGVMVEIRPSSVSATLYRGPRIQTMV